MKLTYQQQTDLRETFFFFFFEHMVSKDFIFFVFFCFVE